jgi:hypothetical protein
MLKVVQPGMFTDHELGGDFIFNKGLLLNNCQVDKFDYQVIAQNFGHEEMEKQLIELCKGKDLIFIGKGRPFKPEMLEKIKHGGTKVLLWYGDIREPEKWLLDLMSLTDAFFISSGKEILEKYFKLGKPQKASFYFNPSDPDLVNKYNDIISKSMNITFTGRFSKVTQKTRKEVITYLKSRSDVDFFGGLDKSVLINILSKVKKRITGSYLDMNEVRGKEYIDVIKKSKIGIGVNAFDNIPYYSSDRLTHYLMFGTFFLTSHFPYIEELFTDKELVWYKSIQELDEKIKYYLNHDEDRETIAFNGQKKMLELYNTKNMTEMMLEILFKGESKKFDWIQVLK